MTVNKRLLLFFTPFLLAFALSCGESSKPMTEEKIGEGEGFQYVAERFADLRVLRYQVPGFDELPLQQKKLLYYLSQAALSGRDIIWDQNYRYNLRIRRTLEAIMMHAPASESEEYGKLKEYTKRVWFSNGIHHHYAYDKFVPEFSEAFFSDLVRQVPEAELPLVEGQSVDDLLAMLMPVIFDANLDAKKVNKNPDYDPVSGSAVNFYEGVNEAEVDAFYKEMKDPSNPTPISYGLNSKLIKEDGEVKEVTWKIGGMYSAALEKVAYWLEKAIGVAESEPQKVALEKLVAYYKSGDLADFDAYNIAWVQDTDSEIDVINGFIEVYNDPKGYRGSFESVVAIRDPVASKRIVAIGDEAQWFEDNSPIMDTHKKANVTGISARVINVVMESGDASPATPIGINLPNANWIRQNHGSKSVNLANIVGAYEEASKGSGGALSEFAASEEEIERVKAHGSLADALHTDMHEVIGHASGQLEAGVGTPKETLKSYGSTIEEGRADLVALYYMLDPKLVEMGLMESVEVGKASYDDFIRNGLLTQLRRIKEGDDIEEDHMRNRAFISRWCLEKGAADNVIEKMTKDGKTYFKINDYDKLRGLFGELLREVQRISSQGDFEAAKELVENYGVKVDPDLHAEVMARFAKLNIAPYSGFINPQLEAVMDGDEITDVKISYPDDFQTQMLHYAKNYSFLPHKN